MCLSYLMKKGENINFDYDHDHDHGLLWSIVMCWIIMTWLAFNVFKLFSEKGENIDFDHDHDHDHDRDHKYDDGIGLEGIWHENGFEILKKKILIFGLCSKKFKSQISLCSKKFKYQKKIAS